MDYYFEIIFITRTALLFVLERYMRLFFDKRRTGFPVMLLSYLAFPVGFTALNILLSPFIGALPVLLAMMLIGVPYSALLFVMTLNYEGTWKKKFVAVFFIFAVSVAIESAVTALFGVYVISIGVPAIRQSTVHLVFEMITTFSLMLIVVLVLQNFKNIRRNVAVLPVVWVSVLAIPLSSISALLIIYYVADMPAAAKVSLFCIIFGINIFVFYLLDRISASHAARLEAALAAQEKDYYAAQCRLMQETVEQTSSARHDMKTHLVAISGYAAKINAREISAYLAPLIGAIGEMRLCSSTGNIAFDSIINYKLKNASKENIRLETRLRIPPALDMEFSNIAVILGNLLDNALEAVANAPEKLITLDIEHSRQTLFIKAKNTFDGIVAYAAKNPQPQDLPLTRKTGGSAGGSHGHGLKNIARAVAKYDGRMNIAHEGGIFSGAILLYIKASGGAS